MRPGTQIVYEYKTEIYPDGNRITGWQEWNLSTYPEKATFVNNQAPTENMKLGLFNGDRIPRYILNANGSITDAILPENEKIKLGNVKKTRFESDFPLEKKVDLLLSGIEDKNDPAYKEFLRRHREIKALTVK
jgi:hypothetical protein